MAAIFGERKIFLKIANRHSLDTPWIEKFLIIGNSTFIGYSVGQKFRRNRSISHG